MGFEPPSWHEVAAGACPPFCDPENEPGTVRRGWQQEASSCVEQHFQVELLDRLPEQVQVLIRSQAGPGAGAALSVWRPRFLRSVWFSCAIFSPCPCATAHVAVYATPLAIIEQLVHGWGCLVVGALLWRALRPVSVGKLEDGFAPTCF